MIVLIGVGFDAFYTLGSYQETKKLLQTPKFKQLELNLKLLKLYYQNGKKVAGDQTLSFNKLKPLPEGELRTAVEEYCQSQGFPLLKLYEMDASKRSTKLNAFFSGMGKVKIIGLYDTLIEKLTTKETVAVLAHEVGHYKRKHVYTMFAFSNVQTLVIFANSLGAFCQNKPKYFPAIAPRCAYLPYGADSFNVHHASSLN